MQGRVRQEGNKVEEGFREKGFYVYKFLSDCLPIYALYTILFREKGLSVTEISLLLSFWSLTELLLELPSGILADRWNRRHMLCVATALKAACYVVWCLFDTFSMFGLGFLFWGVAGAFTSGTEEGLVYDNLRSENREGEFAKIYGKGRFYATLGILTAIVSSGALANVMGVGAISMLSAALCAVNLVFACRLREKNYYSERVRKEKIGYLRTFREAVKLCVRNVNILVGMVFLVFVVSVTSYLDEFDALIIDDFKLGYVWVSVILTVRFVSVATGDRIASASGNRLKSGNMGFALAVLGGLSLLAFSLAWNPYAVLALGVGCMVMAIVEVVQVDVIQSEIKEEGRTTVMSLYSIAQNAVMIVFSLVYALLSGVFSLRMVYVIISIWAVAGAVVVFFWSVLLKSKTKIHKGL